jgi:diketogulonate reductase-like aldo/keto reductase
VKKLKLSSRIRLNNGIDIPILGLGTWPLKGKEAYQAVLWALDIGYRLIATASYYGNEKEIGDALHETEVAREDIFITTKVWNSEQGYNSTLEAFERSLKQLNLKYIDLYLIHWPISGLRNETWKALEEIYDSEQVRAIGVSNYTVKHLKELLELSTLIPAVNQVEFSPFLYQKDLIEFCQSKEIAVEAYSPLTRGRRFNNSILQEIIRKYNKTPAQVLIRWGLQHSIIEIPKSGNKDHLIENSQVFDFNLDEYDMNKLDTLNEDYRIIDDPHLID